MAKSESVKFLFDEIGSIMKRLKNRMGRGSEQLTSRTYFRSSIAWESASPTSEMKPAYSVY
jgi:hypothetical protein